MKILVIAEAQGSQLRQASRCAITLAKQAAEATQGEIEIAILGDDISAAANEAAAYAPTLALSDASLAKVTADRYGAAIALVAQQRGADLVVVASTSQGKDCIPRAAAQLGGTMVTDAIDCEIRDRKLVWRRTMHAGSVAAWVATHGSPVFVTVLTSEFDPTEPGESTSVTRLDIDVASLPSAMKFESVSTKQSGRPDVTEAAIVVSGGRAFKTAEDYERLIGGLADNLGAGTGSSRAAVDAGIAPNENQVGQTGKIIAPDLYLGIGISGAVQHLAGMKNSKIIAAINTDDEAPLLDYADYALIADAYEAIPEMLEELQSA